MPDLHIISWNVTRRCNLECAHCYLPAQKHSERPSPDELTTREAFQLIDQIALVNPEVMLILSGGEPLMREDVFEIAEYAVRTGMMVVLGSNGILVNLPVARKLKKSGVSGISISLDSIDPAIHDSIRSCKGAWEKAIGAIEFCREAGLSVQVNTVVTKKNRDEIPELCRYAQSRGAKVFSPFFLVCTGRGEELTDLSSDEYEETLKLITELQGPDQEMKVRTRCAPTVRRILYQKDAGSPLLNMGAGQCLAAKSYCRILPEGHVTPCPYMTLKAGNVREQEFIGIWNESPLFKSLRNPSLKGKCGCCTFRHVCGGCRARAHAVHNDVLQEDPWCNHVPSGGEIVELPTFDKDPQTGRNGSSSPVWTGDAEERLKKVPSFVRGMVRRAVERYAADNKLTEITTDLMEEVKRKAGMGGMGGHR